MSDADTYSSDVAFTPTVKAIQARKGSRGAYGKMEQRGGWQTSITADLAAFIEAQISVFLATANSEGHPYIQHRGGPPGFLRVLDEQHHRLCRLPPATGNTSPKAIWPTTPGRICS